MPPQKLLIFMGTQCGGMREVANALRRHGFRVGLPAKEIENPHATRHQPTHEQLWYWRAVRRFFEDFGLPPIAEIPDDRLSCMEQEYYVRAFARSLGRSLDHEAFICADHLTSLVLPLLYQAVQLLEVECRTWFFFAHPASEVWQLKHQEGIPPRLAEFAWRNMAAAAGRHNRGNIHFIDMDGLDQGNWQKLLADISAFYGCAIPENLPMPVITSPFTGNMLPAAGTMELYETMRAHATEEADWRNLARVAKKAWIAQVEQNGWQYLDCLDCGEMDAHSKRLLDGTTDKMDSPNLPVCPAGDETWADLLDNAERELLQARQEYETRLFLQAQSLSQEYINCLTDVRLLNRQNEDHLLEKRKRIAKRRKARYRKLFEQIKSQ